MTAILGIDISKKKFDVALLVKNKINHKIYANNEEGFNLLETWLISRNVKKVHACMESTGIYSQGLANFLYNKKHKVSVVNPTRIKGQAQSTLCRNKTDKSDAKTIAFFCHAHKPSAWEPVKEHIVFLQKLVRRYDQLNDLLYQEKNREESKTIVVETSLHEVVSFLKKQIEIVEKQMKDLIQKNQDLAKKEILLNSIPGVGNITIAKVLAFLGETEKFDDAKRVVSFIGLSPKKNESGSSVNKKTRISKAGDPQMRRALYMPALVAIRYNPLVKIFYENLLKNGKCKKLALCAAMRKLIHIIYGVLKSGKMFDPCFLAAK
jgi:transposase